MDRSRGLFHEALARAPAEPGRVPGGALRRRPDLRAEVEALLRAHATPQRAHWRCRRWARTRLKTGMRVGPYEVLAELGAGGMGEVYRARDAKLGRDVAIKILPAVFTSDPERLARFEREARILAALNHPHIGAIYGVRGGRGIRALVLELVDGPTLADRIADAVRFRSTEALAIARQIADALEAAHEQGHHPSRSETGQHQDHVRRRRQGPRLRPREGVRAGEADTSRRTLSQSPTHHRGRDARRR